MPEMIKGSQTEPPHPYGYCRLCQSSVEIPGLTDSKCSRHGWISTAFSVTGQIQKQPAETSKQKQIVVLSEEEFSTANSPPSTRTQQLEGQVKTQASSTLKFPQPINQAAQTEQTQLDLWGSVA